MLITIWNSGFADHLLYDFVSELRLSLSAKLDIRNMAIYVPHGWMDPHDPTIVIVEMFLDKPAEPEVLAEALGKSIEEIHLKRHLRRKIKVVVRPIAAVYDAFWNKD